MLKEARRAAGWLIAAAVAAALHAVPATVWAQGCAMCATMVDGTDDPLARGLNVSILFMLSMPFLMVASVGTWFTYMYWRSRPRQVPLRLIQREEEGVP